MIEAVPVGEVVEVELTELVPSCSHVIEAVSVGEVVEGELTELVGTFVFTCD